MSGLGSAGGSAAAAAAAAQEWHMCFPCAKRLSTTPGMACYRIRATQSCTRCFNDMGRCIQVPYHMRTQLANLIAAASALATTPAPTNAAELQTQLNDQQRQFTAEIDTYFRSCPPPPVYGKRKVKTEEDQARVDAALDGLLERMRSEKRLKPVVEEWEKWPEAEGEAEGELWEEWPEAEMNTKESKDGAK